MKNIFKRKPKQEYKQCTYWNDCKQIKEFEVCMKDYTKCIIYQRMKVLDKIKPKTGLERFDHKYPKWLGIGAMTERPRGLRLEDLDNGGLTL